MKESFYGLNTINLKGSRFNSAYGYSEFVKFKLDKIKYIPIITAILNTWGVKNNSDRIKEKVYGVIKENKNDLRFEVYANDFELNGPFVAGYFCLRFGESIWGPSNGFKIGKSREYQSMLISTYWNFNVKNGFANFAYDIWLTKKDNSFLEENDIEIMIWLDKNFDLPHKVIGETKDFIIKYTLKDEPKNQHWFTFIPKIESNNFRFDLVEVINSCKSVIKNIDNYFIRSIDLGIEFNKNTIVNAKLKELNFDFKKK